MADETHYSYVNGELIEVPPEEIEAWQATLPPPPAPRIPDVTQAQAKIALSRAGLLDQVKAVVAAYPEEVQIWFGSAGVWERGNTYVAGIALELDMSDDTVDELFVNAAKIA